MELAAEPLADRALEGAQRRVCDVADGDQAEPVQHRLGLLADAVELPHVERVQERGDLLGGTTTTPSGLARRLASLATEIEAATPTEQ